MVEKVGTGEMYTALRSGEFSESDIDAFREGGKSDDAHLFVTQASHDAWHVMSERQQDKTFVYQGDVAVFQQALYANIGRLMLKCGFEAPFTKRLENRIKELMSRMWNVFERQETPV